MHCNTLIQHRNLKNFLGRGTGEGQTSPQTLVMILHAVASSHIRFLGVDISLDLTRLSVDRHVSRVCDAAAPAYPAVAGL